MELFNHIYVYLIFAGLFANLGIALYVFIVYKTQVARSFAQIVLIVTIWLTGSGFSAISPNTEWAEFWWYEIRFSMILIIPFFTIKFALQYVGKYEKLKPVHVLLLGVPPLAFLLFNLTNNFHDLVATKIYFENKGGIFLRTAWTPELIYWMHATVITVYSTISFVLLLRFFMNSSGLQKTQTAFIILSFIIPVFFGIPQSLFRVNWGQDFLGLSVAFTCVINSIAIFRYQLFSLTPIARNMLIEGMEDLVLVTDNEKNIIDLNKAVKKVLDSKNTPIGKSVSEIFPQLMEENKFIDLSKKKTVFVPLNGDFKPYDVNITPIKNEREIQIGNLIVMRNISELHSLISDLDAYARTVAHDLKNPLSTLRWYVELSQKANETSNQKDVGLFLNSMSKLSGHLNQIIDEILLFAGLRKVDEKDLKQLDMDKLITNVKERLSELIEEKGAKILHYQNWPEVINYPPWIEEILANYISYAINYGGIPPIVEVSAQKLNDNEIKFVVKDNGKGIDKDEIQNIINNENDGIMSYQPDGKALTLSIVSRIIKKLKGRSGIESTSPKGTVFYFILPSNTGELKTS